MDQSTRVRKRQSYGMWKRSYKYFTSDLNLGRTQAEAVMLYVHRSIDAYHGYKSIRNSQASFESLRLVIDDTA